MLMEERKKRILEAIILDYIATAEPVGSRTISKKYDLGVSPATVRNEMADLEDMGLIEQPHTSAGRIPSQIGYRYYVDYLMEREALTDEIKAREDLIRGAVRLLSQVSNYTALLVTPTYSRNILTHVQLLPLSSHKMGMILVLDNGHVDHQVLDMQTPLDVKEVEELSEMLRQAICGLTVEQWRKTTLQTIRSQWDGQVYMLKEILDVIEETLTVEYERKLYLSGTLNMMSQPEFRNVDKLKGVLSLLEEQRIVEDLMLWANGEQDRNIAIRIGTENDYEGLAGCSLVTATYQVNGRVVGKVGLLGPTRMEYSRTTGLLDFVSQLLTEGLKE